MSNALERMKNNKNTRLGDGVDKLLYPGSESEIEKNIENEIKNTSANNSENDCVIISNNTIINENINAYVIANKKPKFEELHKKDTFWVRTEVLEKLHGITKGNKGLKTQIINEALELFFKKNKI